MHLYIHIYALMIVKCDTAFFYGWEGVNVNVCGFKSVKGVKLYAVCLCC